MTTDNKDNKETDNEEVVSQNNPREEMRKHLYAQADERRDQDPDFADVADEDHDKTVEVADEPEKKAEAPAPAKRKFKVNGEEIELTEEEVAEWVQKGKSADAKFQEAARIKREAEEIAQRAPVKTAPEESVVDDDAALARAIQMGSEEEAVAAIKKLRAPSVKTADVMSLVDQRLSFETQKQRFLGEYKDVMEDPAWREIVLDREEQLAYKGEKPGYDRMKKAGDWARDLKKKSTPPAESTQLKLERKVSSQTQRVTAANVRQAAPEEEDKDESTSETIAGMAKARGQRVVMGNV